MEACGHNRVILLYSIYYNFVLLNLKMFNKFGIFQEQCLSLRRISLFTYVKQRDIMYLTREQKIDLLRNVGLFGVQDLRKLAPIGDLGYENGWYPPFFGHTDMCLDVWLPRIIMRAFNEQYKRMGYEVESSSDGWANTDHHSCCKSLSLYWHCDSSG